MATKGDYYHKLTLDRILREGYMDENPRPHYEDIYNDAVYNEADNSIEYEETGRSHLIFLNDNQKIVFNENGVIKVHTPAYTKSVNHVFQTYDLSKGECPIETLRPIAWKSAINEILWIYQMQSNRLDDLHNLNIKYWDDWDIGDGTIGCRYGATIRKYNLIKKLIDELEKDPFGRRHIMSMWQEADFKDETGGTTKGLNPCCYETIWHVRRGTAGKLYLDMLMNQRSSDYEVSCAINELQYIALQLMIAKHLGYEPGVFSHMIVNAQIYDRHFDQAKEIIKRTSVECNPRLVLKEGKTNFWDFTIDDFVMVDYPVNEIKEKNPQLKFDLGI